MTSVIVRKNEIDVVSRETYTAGSVNVYTVNANLSNEWRSLSATPVFRAGNVRISTVFDEYGSCIIPHEVLAQAGKMLEFGVYGVNESGAELPTLWANLDYIREGTSPGDNAQEPTPSLYDQLVGQVGAAVNDARGYAEGAAASANAAVEAKTAAETAKTGAVNAANASETARDAAETAKTGAETARDAAAKSETAADAAAKEAQTASDTAAKAAQGAAADKAASETAANNAEQAESAASAAAAEAETAKTGAETASAAAETAKTGAETASAAAETAKTGAETASAAAETAKTGAEAARDAAQGYASDAQEALSGAQGVVEDVKQGLNQLKDDISNLRFGDPYDGVDLVAEFADEISASPYNGDAWAWIKDRIKAGNYTGIHIRDYIPIVTTNNVSLKARVMGIDTYRNYGDTAVGHHIDWCCEELWPTIKPINPVNYNNGLIPVENVASDGTSTSYTLTKEMNSINTITLNGEGLTGYSYDAATFTITFDEAPASGTLVVTGNGTQHAWLASDIYHWANSLAGQVPNSTGKDPAVKHVDYTQGGIYYYLPANLKAAIIEKRMMLPTRYSATGVLSVNNSWAWANIGKIWFPTEVEVYGMPVWAYSGYEVGGSAVQYPLFMGNMNRVKYRNGSRDYWWLLSAYSGNATHWGFVHRNGYANIHNASTTYIAAPVCFRIG